MKLLSENNTAFDMNNLGGPAYYTVFSRPSKGEGDFKCELLDSIAEFSSYGVELIIEDNGSLVLPIIWAVMCSDCEELIPIGLYDFRGRTFETLLFNPLSSFYPRIVSCRVGNMVPNIVWNTPPQKPKTILCIPVEDGDKPNCIMVSQNQDTTSISIGEVMG